jgi:hypothetical protein
MLILGDSKCSFTARLPSGRFAVSPDSSRNQAKIPLRQKIGLHPLREPTFKPSAQPPAAAIAHTRN